MRALICRRTHVAASSSTCCLNDGKVKEARNWRLRMQIYLLEERLHLLSWQIKCSTLCKKRSTRPAGVDWTRDEKKKKKNFENYNSCRLVPRTIRPAHMSLPTLIFFFCILSSSWSIRRGGLFTTIDGRVASKNIEGGILCSLSSSLFLVVIVIVVVVVVVDLASPLYLLKL